MFTKPARDEEGLIGIAIAIAVAAVLVLMGTLVANVANSSQSNTAFRRIQIQALDAAEGGLNSAYEAIGQSTSASSLPCAETEQLPSAPTTSSYAVTISYYTSWPITGSALTCSGSGNTLGGSTSPSGAKIVSAGTDGRGAGGTTQYMGAEVQLTLASSGSVFNDAIFSDQTLTGTNAISISSPTDSANIYTNHDYACANSTTIQGSVTTQGAFTGSGSCTIQENVISVGNLTAGNSTTIFGNASSTGSSGCSSPGTQGSISLSGAGKVVQNAYAYCSINIAGGGTVQGQKSPNDTSLTNPPVQSLPSVPEPTGTSDSGAKTAWVAAGYNVTTPFGSCPSTSSFDTTLAGYTSPTVVVLPSGCAISWSRSNTITLSTNIAVFSTGGFSMNNQTLWYSNDSTQTRLLYLIDPSSVSGTTQTCSSGSPGISLGNQSYFDAALNVLMYTPCTLSVANQNTTWGQFYGGTVNISNSFTATYVPLPTVPGASGGGLTGSSSTTIVNIAYERQCATAAC